MKFRAFRRKNNNLYYFQFLSDDEQVRLNSPSFADKDLCFNGIRQVIGSSTEITNYEKKTDEEGKHFFILSTSKGQEIGRSVKYDAENEVELAIAQFMAEAPKAATKESESKQKESSPKPKKTAKDKKGRVLLKQNQAYLCNNITYDTFQSEGNQRYYFVFNNAEGNAVLINGDVRGFETEEQLENGIKEIFEFAPKAKNYEKRVAKNGKHYFILKNAAGKSIAKSSHFFSLKKEMNAAIKLVQCADADLSVTKKQAASDDYLPIAAYAGAEGFHTFQNKDNGKYYFAFNNADGKTFLRSEGYQSESARDNGIQSVIKNGPKEKSWKTFSENDLHYYTLKAGNHQEIARSDYYEDEAAMLSDYQLVKGENSPIGVGAAMVGGALMSALMLKQQQEAEAEKKAEAEQKVEQAKLAALAAANLEAEKAARQKAEAEKLKAEQEAKAAKLAAEKAAAAKLAAEEEEKKKAAAAAALALTTNNKNNPPMETTPPKTPPTTPPPPPPPPKNNSDSGMPGWILPLIIVLLIILAILIYFKGCNKPTPPPTDPVTTVDTVEVDTSPYGKGGDELGFIPGSMEFMMADHLKAYDSTFPRTFTADNIAFAKNKIRLNTKAKKQLDNLAVLLKEYPNAEIEIYGYVAPNEKAFYKGNKEVSLDDARAGEVAKYLQGNGIEGTRMEFLGNGADDAGGVKIKLVSRGMER